MNISNARATFGLNAKATPTSSNIIGTVQIGANNSTVTFPSADVAYSLRAIFVGSGDALALTLQGAVTTGSTAFVAGAAQVETATAAGTVSASGNASVVVTAAGMTGSPITLSVAVATSDTATLWAAKVRAALAANAAVSALFTVGGTTTAIALTRKPTSTFAVPGGTLHLYAANDATLNIALATGTATGITTAATSTNTTAGVISDGVKIYDNATDFEGNAIPAIITTVNAVLLSSTGASAVNFAGLPNDVFTVEAGSTVMFTGGTTSGFEGSGTFTAAGVADLTITVIGKE